MNILRTEKEYLTIREERMLLLPVAGGSIGLGFFLILQVLNPFHFAIHPVENVLLGLLIIFNTVFDMEVYLPHISKEKWSRLLFSIINSMVAGVVVLNTPALLPGVVLICSIFLVLRTTILIGKWYAYFLTVIIMLCQHIRIYPNLAFNNQTAGDSLLFPLLSLIIIETTALFYSTLVLQNRRRDILNRVSANLTSSLDVHQVITLIGNAIQNTIKADTFSIGFLDGQSLNLELLYDDGEFFPNSTIPLEGTLSSIVLSTRKPLVINDTDKEAKALGMPPIVLGKQKRSLSWIGVPLEIHNQQHGLIIVASYKKNAFNLQDLNLLNSFTLQASMALENAYHHQEVVSQSHLDSLTGALTHGYSLEVLKDQTRLCYFDKTSLGLIMLDIDKFKDLNDTYGHISGDELLVQIVTTIKGQIKSSDYIGRWGGEEFLIILPGVNNSQAVSIANRIKKSIQQIIITARNGTPINPPTISQGIAIFPQDASDIYDLIDCADKRLYEVKSREGDDILGTTDQIT
jgi:diguanylate cyclase (GGDEF)-like protein